MQSTSTAQVARLGPVAVVLAVLCLLCLPLPAAHAARSHANETVAMPSAGWHGHAIQKPLPPPRLARTSWPKGWSAGPVGFGTGYGRPGGSDRVREVQRRLTGLGYRPGPIDGLFGPRTQAATRWFQYKHGLSVTGRVTRSTLTVLQARSDHKPLPTSKPKAKKKTKSNPETKVIAPLPTPEPAPAPGNDVSVTWLLAGLLILLALVLGALTSMIVPELRRVWRIPARPTAAPAPPSAPALPQPRPVPAPAPERRREAERRPRPQTRRAARVVGYATIEGQNGDADRVTAALALRCNYRGWSLVEVVHDRREPGRSLTDRPGLIYAVNALHSSTANGLVVARLRDFTSRIADLATLLKWLDEADAFLGAADHELDTSTRAGRGTAAAIIELGRWERQRIAERTRADLVRGRFTPNGGPTRAEVAHQVAAMNDRGLSLRAIADALNIAGIPGPVGHSRWQPPDVKAAKEERNPV